jgi:hypothetical protein
MIPVWETRTWVKSWLAETGRARAAAQLILVRPELQQVHLLEARFHAAAPAFLSRLVHKRDIGLPERECKGLRLAFLSSLSSGLACISSHVSLDAGEHAFLARILTWTDLELET